MSTGLQRHVHSRPSRILSPLPAVLQRRPLSMQIPQLGMKPLTDHPAIPHNHSPDQWIRADPPATALSQLQGSPQMVPVGVCKDRSHQTD